MSEIETVSARLVVEILTDCPKCDYMIDLLREEDTNGDSHDDDAMLIRQVWPSEGSYEDFECEEVVCSKCKAEFNVRNLEW
jgi:hypothetical protein